MQQTFREYEHLNSCPVCRCSLFHLAYRPDVVRCRDCRVLFRNPRPTQKEIIASYDGDTTYADWERKDEYCHRLWIRRIGLVQRFKPQGCLLDVGAGDGRFLEQARKAGFAVEGTEVSEAGIERACARGVVLRKGQLLDFDFADQSFDVITMWHILEHLPNPGEVLQKLCAWLKRDGILIVAVPNESHAIWKSRMKLGRAGGAFCKLMPGQEVHLTCFQPGTLKRALKRAGFRVQAFMIDDYYPGRSLPRRIKNCFYAGLARCIGWHPAAAMIAVCRRNE